MLKAPDDYRASYSDDDESNGNAVAGVSRRVRFVDDNNVTEVTNDKEAVETVKHRKLKFTKRY